MIVPEFETKKELFKFLKDNRKSIEAQKKAQLKKADGVSYISVLQKKAVRKAETEEINDDELKVKVVINTTNLMDSHMDVHLAGIWKKSLQENKAILFLQEHQMAFNKIIADGDELEAYTQSFSWKDLGYDFEGNTEALVFDATIKRERNPEMFKQYLNKWVKEHSVGMRYVKLILAINSDEKYYAAEKEAWDKYYPEIANKEAADESGYFWAVKEAKVVEGSAVPKGSNYATPTLEITEAADKSTSINIDEPSDDTQSNEIIINLLTI